MSTHPSSPVYVALVHYPVYNKNRKVVRTCLTPLDLHDIARAGRTYGIQGFFFVNPMRSQRDLAQTIHHHWTIGWGARYNPNRKEALSLVRITHDLEGASRTIEQEWGKPPKTIATGARIRRPDLEYAGLRAWTRTGEEAYLILFGTGWGLLDEQIQSADYRLAPIRGRGDYNHLPVRSAVSIILDRILCERQNLNVGTNGKRTHADAAQRPVDRP
jgi:hypothetical protein